MGIISNNPLIGVIMCRGCMASKVMRKARSHACAALPHYLTTGQRLPESARASQMEAMP